MEGKAYNKNMVPKDYKGNGGKGKKTILVITSGLQC